MLDDQLLKEMIELTQSEIDDIDFILKVQTLTQEFIQEWNPEEVFLFKVDNWFDTKWLSFTGKILGAVGTWHHGDDSRIPPFHPNRILEEGYYKRNEFETYTKGIYEGNIHRKQSSENNLHRKIKAVSESAVFMWYSSNTVVNNQGSLMIYPVKNGTCEPFYVGFKKDKEWKIVRTPGTNKKTLEIFLERNKNMLK